jgi:hypothetical protein
MTIVKRGPYEVQYKMFTYFRLYHGQVIDQTSSIKVANQWI